MPTLSEKESLHEAGNYGYWPCEFWRVKNPQILKPSSKWFCNIESFNFLGAGLFCNGQQQYSVRPAFCLHRCFLWGWHHFRVELQSRVSWRIPPPPPRECWTGRVFPPPPKGIKQTQHLDLIAGPWSTLILLREKFSYKYRFTLSNKNELIIPIK